MGRNGVVASTPLVSVIMPTHNYGRFIGEAVRSVLDQTVRDLELIIVDDGSTDDTRECLLDIIDARVLVLAGEQVGISAAMNRGLGAARGRYLARLDSDDRWVPDMLETQLRVLESNAELSFVYARMQAMDSDGALLPGQFWGRRPRYPDNPLRSLLFMDCTSNITVVARREVVERAGGYDETLSVNEDSDLWIRASRFGNIRFVDRVLAHCRRHGANITGSDSRHLDDVLEGRAAMLDRAFADELPDNVQSVRPRAYFNVYAYAGIARLERREYAKAWRAFRMASDTGRNPIAAWIHVLIWVASEQLRRVAVMRNLIDGHRNR